MRSVLLITVDALRRDHLSCFGYPRETSPTICSLASSGTSFREAYSNAPFTLASFPSIMAGIYPLETPYYDIAKKSTLAEILSSAGYETIGFNTNYLLSKIVDYSKGFQHFYDLTTWTPDRRVRKEPTLAGKLLKRVGLNVIVSALLRKPLSPPYVTGDVVLKELQSIGKVKEPFFLWVHLMDVHGPYFAYGDPRARKFSRRWKGKLREARALDVAGRLNRGEEVSPSDLRLLREFLRDVYDDRILFTDAVIRGILSGVRRLSNDVLVVITSDHGEGLHEKPGLVGHMAYLYEPLISIPLIFSVRFRKGSELASSIDIVPTVLSLLKIHRPEGLRGIDLTKGSRDTVIAETSFNQDRREVIRLNESREMNFILSARVGRWKYIRTITSRKVSEELYDLAMDPQEMRDLHQDQEKVLDRMRSIIDGHIREIGLNPVREMARFRLRKMRGEKIGGQG